MVNPVHIHLIHVYFVRNLQFKLLENLQVIPATVVYFMIHGTLYYLQGASGTISERIETHLE